MDRITEASSLCYITQILSTCIKELAYINKTLRYNNLEILWVAMVLWANSLLHQGSGDQIPVEKNSLLILHWLDENKFWKVLDRDCTNLQQLATLGMKLKYDFKHFLLCVFVCPPVLKQFSIFVSTYLLFYVHWKYINIFWCQ